MNREPTPGEWLTVAEAAARLEVSPRAIQRRCASGKLRAKLVPGATGKAWLIADESLDSATPDDKRDGDGDRSRAVPIERSATATATSATPDDALSATERDGYAAQLIEQLKGEVAHLRAANEAHARAEAELRAALREALRMSAKALPAGEDSAPTIAQDAPQREESAPASPTSPAPINEVPAAAAATPATPATWQPEKPEKRSLWRWLVGG